MSDFNYQQAEVFFCDQFVPFNQANVSIASSSVLYGLSIYTVFNAIWDEENQQLNLFRLEDHYKRLLRSARLLQLDCPYTAEQMKRNVRLGI